MREFLYVDDLASASVHIMNIEPSLYIDKVEPQKSHINVGSGIDITIKDLAHTISKIVGFQGYIEFDETKLDGTPRKLMDSSLIRSLGWEPKVDFTEGLKYAYEDFKKNYI